MSERWHRVMELFAAAVGMEPTARAGFLSRACAHDEPIRREVMALLDADAACLASDAFLRGPIVSAVGDLAQEPFPPP